jgi:hypothetical protein
MSDETSKPKPKFEVVEPTTVDDPYDLAKLRVSQDFLEQTPVKKLLTTVPIRKPGQQEWVRIHSGVDYRSTMALLELKEDREVFIVSPDLAPELQGEYHIATLFTAMTRTGTLFLWPVRVPAADGRVNEWHKSMADAAEHAMKGWVRIKANMSLRGYDIFVPDKTFPDREWPNLTYQEILRIAAKDRLILSLDHSAVRLLRGS